MKKNKQNKDSHYDHIISDSNEDLEWFEQFNNNSGIYDVFDEAKLTTLKHQMLMNIKAEINKQD